MVEKAIVASLHRLNSLLESDLDSQMKEGQTSSEMGNLTTCFNDVADSELEVVTPSLFDSKIGLLNFLDTRPPRHGGDAPQKFIPASVRNQGFKLLTIAVKRMARQNLLDDKEMVKELKEVCQHTLQSEPKTDVREECCEPLLLVLADDMMEDETADKAGNKLVDDQLYAFFTARKSGTDASKGVKRQRLRILGVMCEKHHEKMEAWKSKTGQGCLDALLTVLESEMEKCRKDSTLNQVHAGCFEALDGFLQHSHSKAAAKKGFLNSVYVDIAQIVLQASRDEFSRYQLPVAALKLLARHARHLSGELHSTKQGAAAVCGALLQCCLKTNADLKRAAADALDAWLGALRHSLHDRPEVLKKVIGLFNDLTNQGVDARHYCLAVRGYGALAGPIGKADGTEQLEERWFVLAAYLDKVLAEYNDENADEMRSELQQLLPDMVIALADILAELPVVPPEALTVLAKFVLALFEGYPSTISARRFLAHRAWYYLLHVLRGKGGALPQLLDLTVPPALLITVRPSHDPRFAPPGVPPNPGQFRQPCWPLSDLWRSLHTDKNHKEWIRRRRQGEEDEAGVESAQEVVAELVHRRLWRATVALVETLDLHLLASHDLEASASPDQPAPDQPGPAQPEAEEEDGEEGGGKGGARPQASGMTGRERPRSPEDFGALLNVVDMGRLVLRGLPPDYFAASYAEFCRAMVRGATRHPLVSAFFKLLALAMHLIEQGGWYRGFSVQQVDAAGMDGGPVKKELAMEVDGEEDKSEAWGCFCVTVKFAREAMAQSEQCFDDLLAAVLQFVLALPTPMLDLDLQLPALKAALQMGTTVPFVAGVALDWLERRVRGGSAGLGRELGGVLGLLELYLVRHEEEGEGEGLKEVKSLQRKANAAKYQLNKAAASRRKFDKGQVEEVADAREMAMKAVRLLGQLGAQTSLLAHQPPPELPPVDGRGSLLEFEVDLGAGGGGLQLPLDPFLLRVMHLAESSPDRKAKVGACELLHGMVMVAVGKHAQTASRDTELSATRKAFLALFRALLPCVFRLAVDTEAVAAQLFQPLSLQLVRWFASRSGKGMFLEEAGVVLEAVMEGVESGTNGKLREASSEALALYVEWTLRGVTGDQEQEDAVMVKKVLRRLYGLLSHPSVCKRLGALFAVKQLAKGLGRHPRIVDQFLLELFGECVRSLRFAATDHPALQSELAGVSALISLKKLLFRTDPSKPEQRYFDKLCAPRQGKGAVHVRRRFETLPKFAEWLFGMVGSHAKPARRFAMQVLPELAKHIPDFSSPVDWIQKKALPRMFQVVEKDLAADLEGAGDGEGELLRSRAVRAQHLLTALDAYQWLLNGVYVRPNQAFKAPSQLPAAVALFAKQAHHLPKQALETATPSELRRHAHNKSATLYALFKLLATLLERFRQEEPPAELVNDDIFTCILLSLLAPADLHLDVVTDPLVLNAIPDQIAELCPLLARRPALLKRLQDKLAQLEEEAPYLQVTDLKEVQQRLGEDHRLLFFKALLRMCKLGLRPKQDDVLAKRLLDHLLDAFSERRSPAQLAVDDAMLALSLELHGKPMQVWSAVMAPLQREGDRWQDHRCWSFYLAFRPRFDAFLAASDDIIAALLKLAGRKGREYCTVLLRNMLESQRSLRPAANEQQPECQLVTRLLQAPAWLEGLCMPQGAADSFPARLKHGRDILHRLLALTPWPHLDSAARDVVCQCARWLLDPAAGVEVHVEALALLPLLFNQSCTDSASGAIPEAVLRVTEAASLRLDRYFPLMSRDLEAGSEEHRNFVLVFQGLTRAVGECRSAAVLALVRDHLLREQDHLFATQIAEALDGFVLNMTDAEASAVVAHILGSLLDPTRPSDPTSLRVQRRVVSTIACRVLRRLPTKAILTLLKEHLGSLLAILSKEAPAASPGESNKVCVLLVLETVYAVLDYGEHKDALHGIIGKEQLSNRTLTVHLMDFVDKQRHLPALSSASAEPKQAELSLAFHQAVQNLLVTLIRRTQTKDKFYTRYVFQNTVWTKIVDTTTPIELPVHISFKQSNDELAVFRSKYMVSSAATASSSSRSGGAALPDADMGSLSQSLSSLPSLFGYKSSSGPSRAAFIRQSSAGEEEVGMLVLDDDPLSRNACMRPFLAAIQRLGHLLGVAKSSTADLPEWMQPLCDTLSSPDAHLNVRLFIAKLLINHRKAADASNTADLFRPHASHFFDAFFHKEHGLALLLSTPKREDKMKGLENAFNYMVREAGRAWAFVHRLMEIVINSQPALLKANVQVLEVFLVEWRSKATVQDLEESVKRVTMFLKFRKKKGSEDPKEKTQEELAWKTGLQLMCFLLKTEVDTLSEEDGKLPGDWEHLPFNLLQDMLAAALPLTQPPTDTNKVNRQYASNRLLLPATEACGLVVACGEAERQLAGSKKRADELLGPVVQRVEKIEVEAKVDSLLQVLEKLAACSDSLARRLHKKVWPHLSKVHGSFLNACQSVLIAAVRHLARPLGPADMDTDEPGELKQEIVVNLMPVLPSMLSRQDARTQLFALCLLTGYADDGSPPAHGYTGLLGMLSEAQANKVVREALPPLADHRDEQVRFHFFALLQATAELHPAVAEQLAVEKYIFRGLQDASQRIRNAAFSWWHSTALPKDPRERMAGVLERLRMPEGKGTEDHWLGCAAWLVLQLARDQAEREGRLVFENALEDNASFEPVAISTDFASASLPMTPMFAASSLPLQSVLYGGSSQSQSMLSQGAAGDVLATLAEDSEGASQESSLSEGARYVEEQTQAQAGAFLFARAAPASSRPPRNVKQNLPPAVFRRGAFVTPVLPRGGRGAGAKPPSEQAKGVIMARLAENRRAREEQSKLQRRRKVNMLRNYRRGELPDIQIKRWELTRPLQELLLRDSPLAKILLTRLFRGLLAHAPDPTDPVRMRVEEQLNALLRSVSVTSADMVEALLEVAVEAKIHLPADAVAAASQRSSSFFAAIRALEYQIRNPPPTPPPPRAISSPSLSGRGLKRKQSSVSPAAPAKGSARRGEGGATEDDWLELSKLYQRLGEVDVVRGLYSKFSCQKKTTEALQHELEGNFDAAADLYRELVDKDWRVQDGADEWEKGKEPQDLEVDLWNNGQMECLERSYQWKDLTKLLEEVILQPEPGEQKLSLDEALWKVENRTLLPTYLRSLIGIFSQTGVKSDRMNFVKLIEDCWYEGEHDPRRVVLEQELLPETALGLLLSERPNRQWAKELVRVGLERFLEEWGASSEVGAVARESKLRSLQRLVELEESLNPLQHPSAIPALLKIWDNRLPRRQQGADAGEWGLVLGCRLSLLRRMLEAEDCQAPKSKTSAEIDTAIGHTYLALGGMARRQGSLNVARECQRQAEKVKRAGEWQLRCLNARLKLNLVDCQVLEDPAQIATALHKMRGEMEEVDETGAGEGAGVIAARVKLHRLRAEVNSQALRACAESERAQYHTDAIQEYRRAIKLAQAGQVVGVVGVSGRGEQKLHVRLALFCDSQLRALQERERQGKPKKGKGSSAHKGKESSEDELAEVYMTEMLAGMHGEGGAGIAAEHLPRCLQLLAESPATVPAFKAAVPQVPSGVALRWLPQLLSHLARDLAGAEAVTELLARVAIEHPQAVFFAARVVAKDLEGQEGRMKQLRRSWRGQEKALEDFCDGVRLLQHPEKQLGDLFADLRAGTADPQVLAHFLRDFPAKGETEDAETGQYRVKFGDALRKQKEILAFLDKLSSDKVLQKGKPVPQKDLDKYNGQQRSFDDAFRAQGGGKSGEMRLDHLAPKLAAFEGVSSDQRGLVVPGQAMAGGEPRSEDAQVQVASMDPMLLTLASKALPKRLVMRGSDGKEYWWLAKAGEDLRQDERVQQVLHSMNQVLAADGACARRRLALKTYAVVPLSQQVGLLEWVQGTRTLEGMLKPRDKDDEKSYRSMKVMYKKIFPDILSYRKRIEKAKASDSVKAFTDITELRPDDILRRALMSNAATPQAELTMRSNFAASLATMSASHYILGIGDRHLGNTLVSDKDGALVGIDFGHAFGSATQLLPIPELMPFRLTRQMIGVLAPLDAEGLLKRSMTYVMQALRANKHVLKQTIAIFISDPTVDWKRNASNQAKSQGVHDPLEWAIENKNKTLDMKLRGEHPGTVMLEELASATNEWQRKAAKDNGSIAQLVLGKESGERRKLLKKGPLSPSDQVAALVSQATDPLILGHTWNGWEPYL